MNDFVEMLMKKKEELISTSPTDANGNYIEEIIREYLVWGCYKQIKDIFDTFFFERLHDEKFLIMLFQILLDESENYSNDARTCAAFYISKFDEPLLRKYKDKLLYAQKYNITALKPFTNDSIPAWLK